MSGIAITLLLLMAIACVSRRERRHSVFCPRGHPHNACAASRGWTGSSLPLTARYLRRTTDSLRSGRYTSPPGTKAEPTRRNAVLTARIPFLKGRSALRPDGKSRRPGRFTDPSGTHTIVAEIDAAAS